MIVMKFGGTSVKDGAAIDRVGEIIKGELDRAPFVVVSAMAGVTDQLLEIGRLAAAGHQKAYDLVGDLEVRHAELLRKVPPHIVRHLNLLRDAVTLLMLGSAILSPKSRDFIASWGERVFSNIFASRMAMLGIPATCLTAGYVLITDNSFGQAVPLMELTTERLRHYAGDALKPGRCVVMGGYIGATIAREPTTLGRGGSDYSAAIVAAALEAEELQIWTDVDGIMTTDPKIVWSARTVKCLSFAEASELAFFGAKVLHPKTIEPAMDKNIPVYVLNSQKPELVGTRITNDAVSCRNIIKSIAFKKEVSVITVESSRMLGAVGFLADLFAALKELKVSVDMVSTSEVSVSFTLDDPAKGPEVHDALRRPSWGVTLENNMGLVCLVGSDMKFTSGVAARAFGSIRDFNVRMISHGASTTNLAFLVRKEHVEEAVQRLHEEFFREFDPEVFEDPRA